MTVKIPASLIPLIRYHVDMENGIFERTSLNDIKPIQIKYTSSVKDEARNNLFTPDKVLKKYIDDHKDADNQTVYFPANKWSGGELGDVVAEFEPADTNSYYYFQKNHAYLHGQGMHPARDGKAAGQRRLLLQGRVCGDGRKRQAEGRLCRCGV